MTTPAEHAYHRDSLGSSQPTSHGLTQVLLAEASSRVRTGGLSTAWGPPHPHTLCKQQTGTENQLQRESREEGNHPSLEKRYTAKCVYDKILSYNLTLTSYGLYSYRYKQGKANVAWYERQRGSRAPPWVSVKLQNPNCSQCASWYLAWFPLPSVYACVCEWVNVMHNLCKAPWIKGAI